MNDICPMCLERPIQTQEGWCKSCGLDVWRQQNSLVQAPAGRSPPDDRLANELASLTRSIQGLSGNVAKLVEERATVPVTAEDSRWSDEEISSMSRNPVPPYEFNRVPEITKEWFKIVKRGAVTEDEVVDAMRDGGWQVKDVEDAKRHFNGSFLITKVHLDSFAKSRGLID